VKTIAQRTDRRAGQAMLEYVIVFVLLLAAFLALTYCFRSARHVSRRSAALISSENA
jgi:hypothetical protein